MSLEPRGNVNWEKIKVILRAIQTRSPEFIDENALIGGGAAWFYRVLVEKAHDPDFNLSLDEEEQSLWMSKDIDFIGTKLDDYERLLKIKRTGSPPRFMIEDTWIDTPEIGITMEPSSILNKSFTAELDSFQYFVAHPVDVLKEKLALIQKIEKNKRPQDFLHVNALKIFIKMNLCQRVENSAYFVTQTSSALAPANVKNGT